MALEEAYNRISSMIGLVCDIVSGIVFGVISSLSMFRIDKFSILFIAFPILGNFLVGAWQNRYYYARDVEGLLPQRKISYVNRVMYLSDYAKEIRLFGIFHLLHKMYSDSVKQISMLAKKYSKKLVLIGMIHYLFSYTFIFEGLLFYISYITIVHKSISLAEFAVITSIMVTASYIWINVMNAFVNVNKNSIYIMNLRTFLDYNERIPEDSEGIIPNKQIESIEFVNVSFSYNGSEKNVLDNISFKTTNMMSTAIVGFNGAGKSTLMKLLLRLYDPTSALDPIAENELFECIFEDGKKSTTFFISHRLSTTRRADKIFMIENGKIIEEGTHDELIQKAGKYAAMWNAQATKYISE